MEYLEYNSNETISFNDRNTLKIINNGSVDFYLVEIDNNNKKGHRNYVFTLNENCLFPIYENEFTDKSYSLIGIAKEHVKIIEKNKIDNSICDAAMNTFEKCLPVCNEIDERTQKITLLSTLELDTGENMINDGNNGVWIIVDEGNVCINNHNELSISSETKFLPLPKKSFITANTYCRFSTIENKDIINNSESLNTIFKCFQISLNIALSSIFKREEMEVKRIRNRKKNNEDELDASIRHLSKIFSKYSNFSANDGELYPVLITVCKELGVKLRMPYDGSQELEKILDSTGLRSREVLLKDKWWKYNCGVMIAWKQDSSKIVALIPSGHGYKIYENGKDPVKVTENIANTLKSIAISLYVPLPLHSLTSKDLIKYVLKYLKPYDVIMYFCIGIIVSILSLAIPAITENLFGIIVPRQDSSGFISVIFFLIATVFASAILKISQLLSNLLFETKSGAPLQSAIWDRLYHQPVSFYKKTGSAELLRRASCVESMQKLLSGTCIQGSLNIVALICGFILMFSYNSKLALILLGCNILVMIPLIKIGYSIGCSEYKIINEDVKSSDALLQIIQGVAKFKTTGTEIKAFSVWEKKFSKFLRLNYKRDKKEAVLYSITNIISPLFLLILYIFYMTQKFGFMSMGTFLAFSAAFSSVSEILKNFINSAIDFGKVNSYYKQLLPILQECPEGITTASSPGILKGNIELRKITFRYAPQLPTVLRGLSISIPAGSFIAITGSSGCGKSTIIRLLLGFETPEAGLVSYDGQDISHIDCRQIRKQLGVVLQNGKILADDIMTNIIGTSSKLTVDDAWEAAELAGLADDINEMPMGMYTVLGDNGGTLSGGQRQRLLIARALASHPKILIFDEATSAIDNKTQAEITARINELKCTRIVIAHRLSTIKNADKIYFIENGTVAESGTYDELMKNKGLFYEMASRQI